MSAIRLTLCTVGALVALATALPAAAQFQKPEDAVKYRKAALTVLGNHFGRIGAMSAGRVNFDAKSASENAAVVASMAHLPWAGFVAGTDKGDTRAKPEIWTDADKFKEAADKMQAEVAKLNAATKVGTLDALKPAFSAAAATCKSCHDTYRKD